MANDLILTSSGLVISSGQQETVYSAEVYVDTTINSGGNMFVSSGGTVNNTTINVGGNMVISSGGTANSTTINNRGSVYVSEGGMVNYASINSDGRLYVRGGIANGTIVNSGWLNASYGIVNDTIVNSTAGFAIAEGATANDTMVSKGGWFLVSSGGTAENTIIKEGTLYVSNGGTANNTTVNSSGELSVSEGGIADAARINSGARMYVSSGGTVNNITVNTGGSIRISSGGTATDIVENGGWVEFSEGNKNVTFASNTFSNVVLDNEQGATIHSNTVGKKTTVSLTGHLHVYNGGVADDNTVLGSMYIASGGIANDTVILGGGMLTITGGTATGHINVSSGGVMKVLSRGVLSGNMDFTSGALIQMDNKSVLNFDLTQTAANSKAILNDWSIIQGTPDYNAIVNGELTNGLYLLSENAGGFNSTISLVVGDKTYQNVLTVGNSYEVDGKEYALMVNESNELTLAIATAVPADPLVVTTVQDVVDATDGMTSLRESITYANSLGGIQKISFNMKDGDTVSLSDPSLLYRDLRFDLTNASSGNLVTVVLDNLDISGRIFSAGDSSTAGGTVLRAEGANIVVSGGVYSNNSAEGTYGWGGVFHATGETGALTVNGAVFKDNYAYGSGGAIDSHLQITIRDSHFEGNRATGHGGALTLYTAPLAHLIDTDFVNNSNGSNTYWHWEGGAIWVERSNLIYEVSADKTITCAGNSSGYGGFISLTIADDNVPSQSTAEFRVNGILNIGNGDGKDSFDSYVTQDAPYDIFIRKTGSGIMTINAPTSDYDEAWFIEDGLLSFVYASGGDFDGEITISGGQMQMTSHYTFSKLTFQLGSQTNVVSYINDLSKLSGGVLCVDVSNAASGSYLLAEGAMGFNGTLSLVNTSGESLGILEVGKIITVGNQDYALNLNNDVLSVSVSESGDHTAPVFKGQPDAEYRNHSVFVTWDPATDNIAVAGYRLILNDHVYELQEPGYVLENVKDGTYTYQVIAFDEAGNETSSEVQTLTVEPRADLSVRSVQVLKGNKLATTISNLDNVTLLIQVENIGDVKSSSTTAYVYCGEVRLAEIAVAGITPDGIVNCPYTIAAGLMSSGIQDLRVVVNAKNTMSEYSELNNEKTLTLNVEDHTACDLVIGSIGLDKSVYSSEDNAVVTFTVKNIGYVEATASKAYVYAGETLLGSVNVGALETGTETDPLSYTIAAGSLTPGSHAIRIVADGAKELLLETNRENNSAQVQLVVGLCDLNVSKLTISQDVCNTDEDVTLNFTIRNSGTDKAANSVAEIYDGDKFLGAIAIGELSAGLSVSKQFVLSAGSLAAGQHNLRVIADAKSTVEESDETNNARTVVLQVNLKDERAPEFTEVSIQQDAGDYTFNVTATAEDDIASEDELVYSVRYAETKEGLPAAETLDGTTFTLTPEYAGKTMYYQVSATDLAGNTTWCLARKFTVADRTAPEIGNIVVSTTDSKLQLNWETSDNVGVSFFKVYCDGELVSTQDAASFTQNSVSVGSHVYRIEAYDAAGNMSTTGNVKVNFNDSVAPVIESVSAVQAVDGYDITFAAVATDNETQTADIVSRVQYAFAAEDVENAAISGLNLTLVPEDAGKTLYYRVSAADEAGNTVWSEIQSLVIADKTAPDVPTELNGIVNSSGVSLNWTSSTDNVGVAGYQVRYGTTENLSGDAVLVNGNQHDLTALKEGVYYWQTAAVDAAGNASEWSEVKSFRILPEDVFGANSTAEQAYDLGTLSGEQTLNGGALSSADDADWFKFTLTTKGTANDSIQIAFDGTLGDLDLYLYSANGATLLGSANGSTGDSEKISLKELQKGTYLLKAVGKNGAMNTFSISTKKVAGYDMDLFDANGRNDSMEAATVFDLEKTPQATVSDLNLHEAGDTDFYQFTLANMGLEGDGVSINFENSVGDLDLILFDSKGMKIAESAGTSNVESVSFNGLAAGSYYVQVVAAHNAVNEYTLNWSFASNSVASDELEGQEPYAITESVELANLSISAAGDGVTQEDTFILTLNQPGSATSKIRFSNYRSDWNGMSYVVRNTDDKVVLSGIGSEISLDGLEAGDYSLTVDTPAAGSFSSYDISVSLPESAGTKWTYMVYMDADNNLDTYALYDLIAMQQANLDSQIDIYVLVDRSPTSAYELTTLASKNKWDSAWSDTRVGKITYNPGATVSVDWESWGELDTSSIATLKQFVDWAQDQSKSENYGLIMWDHGMEDGSLCVDGTTDADWGTSLSISDISAFLAEKGNIPLVIFNNCLLGSEIVATQMTGSTDVIVVSEAESHPQNSTYAYKKFFSTITADMTAQDMAKVLVQNVQQYGDGTQPSMLSAVDVTDSNLAKALEELAEAVSAGNNNDKTVLINGMAKTLQDGCAYAGSTVYQSDLYDMIVQAMADRRYSNTSDGFKAALANLKSVLEEVVLVSKSVPESRGFGIATFNPVLTVKTYAASGYSTKKVSELIQSYLEANYAANPAWAGLLSDLAKTYQTQYSSAIKTASFSVSSIIDIGKDELISSMDLGCFSGQGEIIDGIILLGDIYLGVTITSEATSTGGFSVTNDINTNVTISILAEDGKLVATGTNEVSFSNLVVGDYYILLQSDEDCAVALSFEADWMTGVDRFDFAQSKANEKFANGNGTLSKANALAAGYYSGLLTYQGDTDWYQIGNIYTEKYKIVLEGVAGMTVAEYDAEGKLVQTARYANGKYTMTVKSMNYLFVEGNADLTQNQVNAYSVTVSGIQGEADDTPVSQVAPQTQTWEKTAENTKYIVELSSDDGHAIQLVVDSNSLDSFQMPAGNYQMRVKPEGGEWSEPMPVVSTEANTEPKLVKSNEDGNADVFFANPIGTWESMYLAQHVGSTADTWGGTKEYASLYGKNKLADIIEGSTDANILLMTDDENGDSLFVDDIYSTLPGSVTEHQSRIAQIDEIRAGFGNDIVDMTSQRFEYIGSGLTIRGGAGNDTIWANKGDNKLFGDAGNDRIVGASGNDVIAGGIGNDRMHGGGGDDLFTFGENWGTDTVEQLAGGSVTLWFASGDIENWNAETLTYSDGTNIVNISGVTADKITLKFGDDGSAQFASLYGMGAFFDVTTERIFEESGKGFLASL